MEDLLPFGFDGFELGSVHTQSKLSVEDIEFFRQVNVVTHNFFPAHIDQNFVINIADINEDSRKRSVDHAIFCLRQAADIGAKVYTIHPGFVSRALPRSGGLNYDFQFDENYADRNLCLSIMRESLETLMQESLRVGVKLAVETEGSITSPGRCLMETPEEFEWIKTELGTELKINFNVCHSLFAARVYNFSLDNFAQSISDRIELIELSHNDGSGDQHKPFTASSEILNYCVDFPTIPHILEFRDCSLKDVLTSRDLLRERWMKHG